MRNHILIIISMFCFLTLGFSSSLSFPLDSGTDTGLDYVTKIGDKASINWTTKVITVKGYGIGPIKIKELGRRKLMAQRAAEMDAYRKMLETVKGVRVTSYIDVGEMMRKSPTVETKTEGMVKGMRLVKVTYSNDGSCSVTMEVNIDKDGQFLLDALNSGEIKVTDNYPKFDWTKVLKDLKNAKTQLAHSQSELEKSKETLDETKEELAQTKANLQQKEEWIRENQPPKPVTPPPVEHRKDYTGLLVDARGMKLKPALAPSILNLNKGKMYGLGVIPTQVTGGKIATYVHGNLEWAKKHKEIGNNPLVVRCIRSISQSNVMISDQDAQKLVSINNLLKLQKVAILI